MKFNIKNIIYTSTLAVGLLASSCSSDFLDVNNTPNNPLIVPPSALMTTLAYDAAFANSNDLNRITSILMQHQAGILNQVATYDSYNIRGGSDNQWNGELFAGLLINSQKMIDNTQATSPVYAGIAKIYKAYGFSMMTDLWGDIPYSEALKGTNILTPKLDTQKDIYLGTATVQSLFDLVKEGMADLDKKSTLNPTADDVVYKGSIANWKRLGNTMLLRFAMIISRADPARAKTEIASALASPAGLIVDNAQDFQVGFSSAAGSQNAIYAFNFVNRPDDQMLSQRFRDTLLLYKDPRIAKFFTLPSGTTYVAWNNGQTGTAPLSATRSRYGAYFTGTTGDAPIRMITNFQRAFMLAEAALSLATAGDAQKLFEEGIRASMLKTGLSAVEIDAYFKANPSVVTLTGSNTQKINQIMTQKWIANCGNGIEAFNDWRRWGFPRLEKALNATAGDDVNIPVRLPYTSNEQLRNPNVPTPGPKTSERVWWDID
jgi:Starch-binding associating with outer membrane